MRQDTQCYRSTERARRLVFRGTVVAFVMLARLGVSLAQDSTPASPTPTQPTPTISRGGLQPPPDLSTGSSAMMPPPPVENSIKGTIPLEVSGARTLTPDSPPGSTMTPTQAPKFPTVIPIEPAIPPTAVDATRAPLPAKFIDLRRDTTGLIPEHPPGPTAPRSRQEVNAQVSELVEKIQEPEAEIALAVGQAKVMQSKRVLKRIAIANPSVADIEIFNDEPNSRLVNLIGKGFGTTTLTLWDTDDHAITFLVRVTLDTKDLEARVKQAFPGATIHIRQIGPQVILEGQVPDSKTMSEVLQVVTAELRNVIALRMQGGGGGGGQAGGAGGGQPGGAGGGGGGGATGGIAGAGGGAVGGGGGGQQGLILINRVNVPGPRQVILKVKIAELNRTAIRQLGINWLDTRNNAILGSQVASAGSVTSSAGATQTLSTGAKGLLGQVASTFNSSGTATPANSQLFGVFNAGQFSLFLNALRSNALAKLLAEPNLIAADGQPAQFQAGGQFPYPVPQSSSIPGGTGVISLQFKDYGAILTFLPTILANDVIRLDVEPVFSALNYGAGTTINNSVVPGIDLRRARTVVELREGQTLAIAGLLQTLTNSSTVRVPGLGDLPVVGPLFSQNKTEKVETELIVLVTPELVAPMEANEVTPAPGDLVHDPNDYEFFFLGRIEGKLGRDFRATVAEHDPLDVMKHLQSENHWVVGPHGHSD